MRNRIFIKNINNNEIIEKIYKKVIEPQIIKKHGII